MNNNNNNSGSKGKGGTVTSRPPALDPRSPLLTQPFKRLVEEGFITEISVIFSPNGVKVEGKPDKRLADVADSGLTVGQVSPVGILASVADRAGFIQRPGQKKAKGSASNEAQPKAKKSLVKSDFSLSAAEFRARAVAVADASGGNTLVGRVRSANAFGGDATISFKEWWDSADNEQRACALTLTKHREALSDEDLSKFGGLQCPFRGTAEFQVNEEEEEDEPAETGSASKLKK